MSKTKKSEEKPRGTGESPLIPEKYQHPAAVVVILAALVIFLFPVIFEGESFLAPDNIASMSFVPVLEQAKVEGVFPLWNPYVFCGMPAYGSLMLTGDRWFDLTGRVFSYIQTAFTFLVGNPHGGWVIFYYVLMGVGMYTLAFTKTRNKIASLVAALGTMFSMYIIIWMMVGHNTKPAVMAFLPFLFLLADALMKRITLTRVLLLILVFHLSFMHSHIQMMFYSVLAVGIYLLFSFFRELKNKEQRHRTLIAGFIFMGCFFTGLAMDADRYLSTLEYNPYSIRGANPIMTGASKDTKTVEGGLDYDYATQWSLSPGEMITFFIPSWYGFGWHTYQGVLTNNQPARLNTYWGPQPFTDAPQYMGIVITVLALLAVWVRRKEPFVKYLAGMIVFSLLVAFGKEFSPVYDLLYNYLPGFNKFRIPSMILVLVQMFVPLLAAYAIAWVMEKRGEFLTPVEEKKWKYVLAGCAALFAVSVVGSGVIKSVFDSYFPLREVAQRLSQSYGQLQDAVVKELHSFVFSSVTDDVMIGVLLLLVIAGVSFLYRKRSVGTALFASVLIAVSVGDLWRVAMKPRETHPAEQRQTIFTPPDHVNYIKQDTSLYRVLEFRGGQPPYDNTLAYFKLRSAYGYFGVKMRAYQDVIDVVGLNNPLLWGLMNVKYVISDMADSALFRQLVYNGPQIKVYGNPAFLPNAFFVNRYEKAKPLDILQKIRGMSFNPREVAFGSADLPVNIDRAGPGAAAQFLSYRLQDFSMKVIATGNNLLFLSESYYPEGWIALLDGKEVPIYRLNYLFRGVVVPPGSHTLEMKFEPKSFTVGKYASLSLNVILLAALGAVGLSAFLRRKKDLHEDAVEKEGA